MCWRTKRRLATLSDSPWPMCLILPYVEAMLWKRRAHGLISLAVDADVPLDPLLRSVPKLSEVVSILDGIKKRHGLLIEAALIAAINLVPDWTAGKAVTPLGRESFHHRLRRLQPAVPQGLRVRV